MKKLPEGHDLDNENLVLSFLMRNLLKLPEVKAEYFLHPTCSALIKGLSKLVESGLNFSLDTLVTCTKDFDAKIEYVVVNDIYDNYTDFTNIDFSIQTLKSDWIKFYQTEKMLKKLLVKFQTRGNIDPLEIRKYGENLVMLIDGMETNHLSYDSEEMHDIYIQELENRKLGLKIRTLGLPLLDGMLSKPGAEGEIVIVFAESGVGKSTVMKAIENGCMNRKVCVLSVNTEMVMSSSLDRLICMRENMDLGDLLAQKKTPEIEAKIFRGIERIKGMKNYRYVDNPTMNFNTLRMEIQKARENFYRSGCLPSDGYILVAVDLLSMFKDFGDMSPQRIEVAMNQLHELVRSDAIGFIGTLQSNENKLRGGNAIFKQPDDLNWYRPGLEDIKGGSVYKERARAVIALHRPLQMKRKYFPEDDWDAQHEEDLIHVHVLKQNDGDIGFGRLLFGHNFRLETYTPPKQNPIPN